MYGTLLVIWMADDQNIDHYFLAEWNNLSV